jgi:hypothetical protein
MSALAVLVFFCLVGCASLPSEVHKNIQPGDSTTHVEEVLGNPNSFEPNSVTGGNILVYVKRSNFCEIYTKNDVVTGTGCWPNPNYVNPIGAMLQGAGQGLQNASRNSPPPRQPTSCITTGSPGMYTTNCN